MQHPDTSQRSRVGRSQERSIFKICERQSDDPNLHLSEVYNGWLNLYKPLNMTSAALVAKVKNILGKSSKVGHCGTLDPLADGILPIAIGEATKLSDYLMNSQKKYTFTIKFGMTTTTGDMEGETKETCDFIPDSLQSLQDVALNFIGKIRQKTPAYSAVKINGKPFYQLAREGLEVPEKIRDIEIFSLKLLDNDFENSTATYEVVCSKGTYVRALAEDIAASLKSLGFVIRLTRVSVKNFFTQNSLAGKTLIELPTQEALEEIKKNLLPVEYILEDIPVFDLNEEEAVKIKQGKKISIHQNDLSVVWLRHNGRLLTIGSLSNKEYNIFRNLNL
jgi:tRNA pseudouridine55 synthase